MRMHTCSWVRNTSRNWMTWGCLGEVNQWGEGKYAAGKTGTCYEGIITRGCLGVYNSGGKGEYAAGKTDANDKNGHLTEMEHIGLPGADK
eukprot:914774-Pelagomonas_calceolata.AAC.7